MAEELSSHDKKQQERQQREQQFAAEQEKHLQQKKRKLMLTWLVVILVIGGFGYWTYWFYSGTSSFHGGNIHWHVKLDLWQCGQKTHIPASAPGAHHRGLPLLHAHDDDTIHVEGYVSSPNEITLGRFMDAVGVKFSDKEFFDKKEGDSCDGKAGKVQMWLNGEPSTLYRDYSARDGDIVAIRFE